MNKWLLAFLEVTGAISMLVFVSIGIGVVVYAFFYRGGWAPVYCRSRDYVIESSLCRSRKISIGSDPKYRQLLTGKCYFFSHGDTIEVPEKEALSALLAERIMFTSFCLMMLSQLLVSLFSKNEF